MDYDQREATEDSIFTCEYRKSTDFYVMLCYKSSLMRSKVDHWPVLVLSTCRVQDCRSTCIRYYRSISIL